MSYALRHPLTASRAIAIAIVTLTQASLGYALASGLTYTVVQSAPDGLKTFNVDEAQPPPPEPARAPKLVRERQPPVVSPRAPVARISAAAAAATATTLQDPPVAIAAATVAPAPMEQPAGPSPVTETVPPRSATGDLQSLFHSEDYPATAIEHKEQGSVTVRLTVGSTGRVDGCDVTATSGSRALDSASCQVLQARALFSPARDSSGSPTNDTVYQEIRWALR